MRRKPTCCLSLVFCFFLSLVLPATVAHGGDLLPSGGCQFFSAADFAPAEADPFTVPAIPAHGSVLVSAAPSSVSASSGASLQLMWVGVTRRQWSFDYRAEQCHGVSAGKVIALGLNRQVRYQMQPRVDTSRARQASLLFQAVGSTSELKILFQLLGNQMSSFVQFGSPVLEWPSRMVRMISRMPVL